MDDSIHLSYLIVYVFLGILIRTGESPLLSRDITSQVYKHVLRLIINTRYSKIKECSVFIDRCV